MEGEKEKRKFRVRQLLTLYLFKRHQNKALAKVSNSACPRTETSSIKSSTASSTASAREQWTEDDVIKEINITFFTLAFSYVVKEWGMRCRLDFLSQFDDAAQGAWTGPLLRRKAPSGRCFWCGR
ncbi:hypothetical protein PHYPO_G00013230 [Pangasianodon hypophthalmus]|uniref:Uncharacterized protein n=1 Tax=Pangasianodon hypophthalmus TaxID=310915 RepID=A0A5N5N3R3_PANHP|nr:hypothetical protein PHYPO_G00013230 [Pangasianodon hypophthalmus]